MDEKLYNIKNNDLTYGRGYVYSLQYHIVWCTKYRRKVLKDGVDADCKALLQSLAEEYRFEIMAMEVMPDHIHLLVNASPQFVIPDMIKIMKGGIARTLFLAHPEMKNQLWGGHLWNPSYCAVTVSERSREMVEQYIESQKEKEWGGRGRPPRDLERLQAYHRGLGNEECIRDRLLSHARSGKEARYGDESNVFAEDRTLQSHLYGDCRSIPSCRQLLYYCMHEGVGGHRCTDPVQGEDELP